MKRGFVYSASGRKATSQPQRGGVTQNSSFRPPISLRKRTRSPELSSRTGTHTNMPSLSFEERGSHQPIAKHPRTAAVGSSPDDNEGDNFLDEIYTEALEQYELTQRSTPSPIPVPVAQPQTSIPDPMPQSTHPGSSTNPVSSRNRKWPNPYQSHDQHGPEPGSNVDSPGSASSAQFRNGRNQAPQSSAQSPQFEQERRQYVEKIQQLQEQNYTSDGEVKVLRSEKERLLSELRRKEEQMQDLHSTLVSEQKAKEQQLSREKEALATKLKFMEQEFKVLQQRCSAFSPIPHPAIPRRTSNSAGKIKPTASSKHGRPEFLSTETFMPLSQMSTDLTKVQVGQRRSSVSKEDQSPENQKPKVATKTSPHTTSLTAPLVRWSSIKERKPTSFSEASTASVEAEKVEETSSRKLERGSLTSIPATERPPTSKLTIVDKEPLIILDVPGQELNGAELLTLLVQHDLLRVPEFRSSDDSDDDVVHQPTEDQTKGEEVPKLTGLLSLLHVPSQLPNTTAVFSNILATPVSSHRPNETQPSSCGSYRPPQATDSSFNATPKTPIRRSKLLPSKPHTCARSDLSRMKAKLIPSEGKSLSAANTPVRDALDQQMTTSLVSSINTSGLEQGIVSLLRSADSSKFSSLLSSIGGSFGVSPSPASIGGRGCYDPSPLLHHIGDIIVQYHAEQCAKVRGSSGSTNISGHLSDLGENLDMSTMATPKSSLSSSTASSKISQEMASPSQADQELASQALRILETLVTYSKSTKELLLAQPPEFKIDSRPSSAMDSYCTPSANESSMEEESVPLERMERGGSPNAGIRERQKGHWKEHSLCLHKLHTSGKVWIPEAQNVAATHGSLVELQHPTPLHQTTRCGQLLNVLLELPAPPWKESAENILICLKILSALSEDCLEDSLERFSSLLLEDTIGVCLDREDPHITLSSLVLLTRLAKSPTIVSTLCSHGGDLCILSSCYQCFLDPPPSSTILLAKIHLQLVQLVSTIMAVANGPTVLFESPMTLCPCSHERSCSDSILLCPIGVHGDSAMTALHECIIKLVKSVVMLLNHMVQGTHSPSQWQRQELIVVRQLVSLLHSIFIHDRYFDSHQEGCEHTYMFVLNTLSWLFKDVVFHEAALVNELLEFCEELEDSEERMDEG